MKLSRVIINSFLLVLMTIALSVYTLISVQGATLDLDELGGILQESTSASTTQVSTEQETTKVATTSKATESKSIKEEEEYNSKLPDVDAATSIFQEMTPSEQDYADAYKSLAPFVKWVNKAIAYATGILSLLLTLISLLDIFYFGVPPLQKYLDGGKLGDILDMPDDLGGADGRGSRGGRGAMGGYGGMGDMDGMGMDMGMGGMGGGYGGMSGYGGMGGYGRRSTGRRGTGRGGMQPNFNMYSGPRLVSNDAVLTMRDALLKAREGYPVSPLKLISSYVKRRVLTLIGLGFCLIVCLSTAFTEVGIKLGVWILAKLMRMI